MPAGTVAALVDRVTAVSSLPNEQSKNRMVEDLLAELRADAEAASSAQPVQLVETHISWVLMGAEVFKLKKTVRFPFLDFGTLEARARACQNEVRINRRLAPTTYLGVVPVRRRPDGGYTFRGEGPVVEWAVRMKRLDDAGRADRLLAAGQLDGHELDLLASSIAAFHRGSATGPDVIRCGAPELIERHVRESFAALRETASDLVPADALAEIERWQIAFVQGRADLFAERMASGSIRDGHGDLRLEHVFFREDGLEIIDGIEFDDRYRWGDVCADVAFLAMDLARLGHADLAERFIATYARAADDFDLYRVLDFYESYRACIRAKIHAASDAPEARRCLLLALSAGRRSLLPAMLVVVAGGIASGKSTVAARLGEALGAPVIDADRTRKHILGIEPTEHGKSDAAWQGAYDPTVTANVYVEVLRRARSVLLSGRSVVLDASFRSKRARAAARELAELVNVPFRLLECKAPLATARARLSARDASTSVSDATPAVLDAFAAAFEPITELPPTEHVTIDTSGALDDAVAAALAVLPAWPAGLNG